MKVPIELFFIGRTQVDRNEVKRWLKFLGTSDFQLPAEDAVTNPALLVALAAKRCYKSFEVGLNPNITRIRQNYVEYLDNVLKSGHGSVLEHSVYTIAMENVSRVFTAEMNRHRAGWAISEGSLRFIRFGDDVPYWEPDSVQGPDVLSNVMSDAIEHSSFRSLPEYIENRGELTQEQKRHATRILLKRAFEDQKQAYCALEVVWAKELAPDSKFAEKKHITSMMRRIIGMGVATGGVWTGNIRALRHVMAMRASPAAEEEMLHVFTRVAKRMRDEEPALFGDFSEVNGYWVPRYVKV